MNLFYQPLLPHGALYLSPEESKHCVKVLRKQAGDPITVTDGQGFFYNSVIENPDIIRCTFSVKEKIREPERGFYIHIAISPTKNTERIDWFVEKAVEIGIDKITFLECKNTERPFLKRERLEKIAISAMKQSVKASLPVIENLHAFSDVIRDVTEEHRFIAYVDHTNPHHLKHDAEQNGRYLVLIGPEGDFTTNELGAALEKGFKKVSLGASRLRTETAGLVACHILNLVNN